MCIRDSYMIAFIIAVMTNTLIGVIFKYFSKYKVQAYPAIICLLYTSDAADERSSVDLGGRRIIKKKK